MINNMIIGRYVPTQSFIHRLDPRSKLLLVFLFVFVVFLANNSLTYGILGIYTLSLVLLTKIHFSFIWKGLKPILWVILFTFLIHVFFTQEGTLIFELGPINIFSEGLEQGVFLSLRFFYLILITTLLTLTTTPIEITDGIEMLLGPLKKVNFPVHEIALMMSISLRFIPTLLEETEKIMKAQMARGAEFSTGPIHKRVMAFIPLFIPLFVNAFKRAEDLAIAMESRGYRGSEGRSKYRLQIWKKGDTFIISALCILAIILIFTRA